MTQTVWVEKMRKPEWKILGTMILDVEETKDVRIYPKECNQRDVILVFDERA